MGPKATALPSAAELTEIRRKQQRRIKLSEDERVAWNAYNRQFNAGAKKVYFHSKAALEGLKAKAKKEGASNFNQWLLDKIELGASGTQVSKDFLERLQHDLKEAEGRIEQKMDEIERYRAEIRELRTENGRLSQKVEQYGQDFKELLLKVAKMRT
jgi:hypothetical protein